MALIARWRFEPGANLWVDSSGNSNTLTPANTPTSDTSWKIEGQSSANFVRASSQRASIANADQSSGFPCKHGDDPIIKIFTICGWAKIASIDISQGFFNKHHATAANACFRQYIVSTTNLVAFSVTDINANVGVAVHATALAVGTVCFWSIGYRETDKYQCIRLRDIYGNIIGTDIDAAISGTWDGINATTEPFYIGSNSGTSLQLDGNLDDVRVYSNEYHTAAQATQICRQSSGLAGKRLMMGG